MPPERSRHLSCDEGRSGRALGVDVEAARTAAGGSGQVALCSIDPLTQEDHSTHVVAMAADAVLVVDGVFGSRPELDAAWDVRVWLQISPELASQRAVPRDVDITSGAAEAERLVRDRYLPAEHLYLAEVDPMSKAEIVIDNTDFSSPRVVASRA